MLNSSAVADLENISVNHPSADGVTLRGQSCVMWSGWRRRYWGVLVWRQFEAQVVSLSEPEPGTGPSAQGWPVSSTGCSPAPTGSYVQSAPWSAPSGPPPPHAQHTSGGSSPGPEKDRHTTLKLEYTNSLNIKLKLETETVSLSYQSYFANFFFMVPENGFQKWGKISTPWLSLNAANVLYKCKDLD